MTPSGEKLFNIIIKLTSFCNLACDYCYVRSHQVQFGKQVMPLTLIEKAIRDYLTLAEHEQAAGIDSRTIKFTWHGGEPLQSGLPYFREILNLQKSIVRAPYRVENSIMTNGIGLSEAWVDFLKEERFEIGISLDGPKPIHDAHRKFREGSGSFDEVMKGIALLQEAHLPFGVLCVITSESAGRAAEMFSFFKDHQLKNISFNPYSTFRDWLSPREYTLFYTEFFDLWWGLDDPRFFVRDFANIIRRIFGRETSLCEYTHCFGNYLGLDTNGDIYICDLLIGHPEFLLGNIKETSLGEAIGSVKYADLKQKAGDHPASCRKCSLFRICTGGCTYRRYLDHGFEGKDIYCSTRKALINHIGMALERSRLDSHRDLHTG